MGDNNEMASGTQVRSIKENIKNVDIKQNNLI